MSIDWAEPMQWALDEARAALAHDDVPIGAVVVRPASSGGFDVVARAHNRREIDQDPTAHAEILALRQAAQELGTWRLEDCHLVVTLEPCAMCAGAVVLSRVEQLVFGADDPKAGAVGSLWNIAADERLNHQPNIVVGVLADECGDLLREFFRARR